VDELLHRKATDESKPLTAKMQRFEAYIQSHWARPVTEPAAATQIRRTCQ
jgi:hypothetical protein